MTAARADTASTTGPDRGHQRRDGTGARAELIAAAERLFAERGIDGVSMREITRAASQRNTTALQYHFGDRDGLLKALVDKHMDHVAVRRAALLDNIASSDGLTLRMGASVLVQPLVAKIVGDDGGPDFLQIAGELVNRTQRVVDPAEPVGGIIYDHLASLDRWSETFEVLMPEGSTGAPLHRRFAVIRFAHIEVGRRARVGPPIDVPLFTSQLIDLVAGLLGAEVSTETARLLAVREESDA
ncbi:putative DNA-binding transcriptional regulator [Nocardioides dokdonensis FR1436]|uniref:Putative DNA-binding transcriptional regulator n=1 Tax=Nocardioides dokdonensis FR1436 TaxID=1300347 RepID=A0A1A9GL16_9ACTN|nr:helix-turn-helix domain-containing protein [Nocardioides dokdonensis]ANH38989.1 putative DNA-binding transcriptional regulator [Nocardioides dokdonensis FR1436]